MDCNTTEQPWVLCSRFLQAIKESDFTTVSSILDNGFDIDTEVMHKKTAISICALYGLYKMAELLIKRGCSLSLKTEKGETPLHLAVHNCDYDIVKLLVENRADLSSIEWNGRTVLHYPYIMMSQKVTAFLISCASPSHINKVDSQGWTPLMYACRHCPLDQIKALISKGAIVNVGADFGSAIFYCLHNPGCSVEMIVAMADAGADINVTNSVNNETLLLSCLRCEAFFRLKRIKPDYLSIAHLLVDRGCDVNVMDSMGESPLHLAVLQEQPNLVRKLLNNGAKVNAVNSMNHTPLIYACRKNSKELVDLLLDAGACLHQNSMQPSILRELSFNSNAHHPQNIDVVPTILYAFRRHAQFPRLSHICRRVIRDRLPKNKESSGPHLPLPNSLIKFVLLAD